MSQPTQRWWLALTVALVTGLVAIPGAVAQEQTLQGEIVDPASFLKEGRHGQELVDRTYEAVDGGQTLALLDQGSGKLYLLLAEEPGEDPNELAYDYVNQQVKATGVVYERGGMQGIVVKALEPLNAQLPAPESSEEVPPQ